MNVQPYLFFDGNCAQAIEFYKEAFGISVEFLMLYKDGPQDLMPDGWSDMIFHATIKFGDSLVNMSDSASDAQCKFNGFAMLVHAESIEAADKMYAALEHGGEVWVPLQKTSWAPRYAIIKDKFGITWKIQA